MNKKRVLITGGSGFLGINLARFLYKKEYAIRLIDIVKFDYKDMNDKVEFILGDIRDQTKLNDAAKNCNIIIHTAAALPLYKEEDIRSTEVQGTKNVIEAAKKAKAERLIHISSTAVYGIPNHHPLFENDKLDGVGAYGQSKIDAEKACEIARKDGMCITIIRPKSFVGPERLGVMAIYYDWIRRGKNIPIIGTGKNKYQLLDVEDLCEAILLCITKPKDKVNDTFNIGAKIFTTMAEDFGAIMEYQKTNKHIIPLPAKPIIAVLRLLEILHLSPLYKWVYETAPEDSFVSIDKAEKQLGYKPKYSNKQALIRNYKWYLQHYEEFKHQTGVSHRLPWKQGILKAVSWFF